MALTTNQLVVGMFNMAAGGYKTVVGDYMTNNGAAATADALLAASGLNPQFMGTNLYSNADFASALVGKVLSGVSTTVQSSIATIVSSYMTANPTLSRGAVVVAVLEAVLAVPTTDATLGTAVSAYTAKVALADASTSTSTDFTALAAVVGQQPTTTGQTFTLTTNADNFTGTSGNDTFAGVAGTGVTLAAGDIISGGSGTDTLSVVTDAAFTLIGANLTSIEQVKVVATGASNVTFSNMTGVTDLINNSSAAALQFGVDDGAAGNDVAAVANLTITGATSTTKVTYADAAVTGSADAMTITMSSNGTATAANALTLLSETAATNELETLNFVVSGTNNITLTTDGTQTSLKTINVSGSGDFTMGLAADNTGANAVVLTSTSTGNVTVGAGAAGQALGAAAHKMTFGAGNDKVFFGGNFNSSDTVDGGAGTDTLSVSAAIATGDMANATNIEVIDFNTNGASISQDVSKLASSVTGYTSSSAANGHTLTLSNLLNGATLDVNGSDATGETLTLSLKDSAGLSDALTLTLTNGASNAATTVAAITAITGLETFNLVSTGGTGTNVITTDNVTQKHVVTGSGALTITNALAASNFDASAATGKINVTGKAATASTLKTGSAADTITLGTGAETVDMGAGNDTLNLGSTGVTTSGADVIAGGAGNDTYKFTSSHGASGAATDYTAYNTITDFKVGTSTSDTDFLAFSGTDTNFGLTDATGAQTGLSKQATLDGLASGNAMVVQTVAQNATAAAVATNASFFKLTTGVAFTTDIKTTAAAAIGTGSVTGLVDQAVYLASYFDTSSNKMVVFTVSNSISGAADTTLSSADMTNAINVVGVLTMTAADYANFGATNLAAAF